MVANFNLNVPETSEEPKFKKVKKVFMQHTEIYLAIHEAMKYKPALTSITFEILENANFYGPKQSCAATKQKQKRPNLEKSKMSVAIPK